MHVQITYKYVIVQIFILNIENGIPRLEFYVLNAF